MIRPFEGATPRIAHSAFLAEDVVVIGDVEIGADASIWYGCVLRGDVGPIRIGSSTNIQEGTILHCAPGKQPTVLDSWVTVGHGAVLHGCHIRERSLVGMSATVLDGAMVGEESIIAANALVPPGAVVPPRTLVTGSPARFSRRLTDDDVEWILEHGRHCVEIKAQYLKEGAGQMVPPAALQDD